MNRISISQAWAYATSFFNGQMAGHAIILIGVGIVIPFVLQFALTGGAMVDTTAMARGGADMIAAMGGMMILTSLISYILQNGSYFASWRLGLTGGQENIGGALSYGVVAALPYLLLTIVVVVVLGIIGFLMFGSALAPMLMGGKPSEAAAMGMVGMMFLTVPSFLVLALWLAARLCCTGPVMADRRSYNILSALGESWRLTAASQWKIMGYFVLLAVALFVVILILGMVAGVSMFAAGGGSSAAGVAGTIIGLLLLGIPMAYLQVAIPVGIYRALGQGNVADVFA